MLAAPLSDDFYRTPDGFWLRSLNAIRMVAPAHGTMKINKQLLILLFVSFISAQLMAALHTAQYGVGDHLHDGQFCQIHLQREQGHAAAPDGFVLTIRAASFIWLTPTQHQQIVLPKPHTIAAPRAPPQLS